VASGEFDDAFRVDVIQGGAGTSTNMNANEVIANLALRLMGHPLERYDLVDPIAHVNKCQSTNDAYALEELLDRLGQLCDAFADQARTSTSIPKIGHTELHDAVPMTLGQKLGVLSVTLDEDQELLRGAALLLAPCSLEATAAGTGITANPEYLERLVDNLSTVSGISHSKAEDLIEATWDPAAFITLSGVLSRTAFKLSLIGRDLVLFSSGTQSGRALTQA
jgi:aspartate ammonia-lyase